MPIIKSAKKRVKVAKKAAVRNSKTKRSLRTAVKSLVKSPSSKTATAVQSNIDKAAKKGVIHKNKAARLKKQASKTAKEAGVKPVKAAAKKATAAAKPAAKTVAKKAAPVKKAVAKKAPVKKPAAKKK